MVATQVIGLDGTTLNIDETYIGGIKRKLEEKTGIALDDIVVFKDDSETPLSNDTRVEPDTTYTYQVYRKVDRVEDEMTEQRIRQARYKEALKRGYMSMNNFRLEYQKSWTVFFVDEGLKNLDPPFVVVEAKGVGSDQESGLNRLVKDKVYTVVEGSYLEEHIEIEPENMWATPPRYQVNSTLPENTPVVSQQLDLLGDKDEDEVEKIIGFSDSYRLEGNEIVTNTK